MATGQKGYIEKQKMALGVFK